jgi:VWFA-related protein
MRPRPVSGVLAVLLASLGAHSPAPVPQQPALTFRAGADYVEVNVIATDNRGRFVRDLTRDEIDLSEDGVPQEVAAFSLVDLPIDRPDRPLFRGPVEPDVWSNEQPFDGRIYLIVLDSLHIDGGRSGEVRRLARRFVERYVAANDRVAVIHLGRADAGQEFTTNRRLLLASVDRFAGRKLSAETANKIDDYEAKRRLGVGRGAIRPEDKDEQERSSRAQSVLRSLEQLSEYLAGLRGRRKALIFFSEGLEYDTTNLLGHPQADVISNRDAPTMIRDTRGMLSSATRGNVSFYAIDPRGQTDLGDEFIKAQSVPDDPAAKLTTETLRAEVRRAQNSLRNFAGETGGIAVVGTRDFDRGFERIVADNSAYFVLGYAPTNRRRDGGFREITVRVKRPNVEVRARRGYYAPRDTAEGEAIAAAAPEAMAELLSSPVPVGNLALRVAADALRGAAPKSRVHFTVEIAGSEIPLEAGGAGTFVNEVALVYRAIDAAGRVQASTRRTAELNLLPPVRQAVSQAGYRFEAAIEVPPGRYQLRVGGREKATGRLGSVYLDLEVPDFSSAPLVMSDLVLAARSAGRALSLVADSESLRQVLPVPPTTAREFARTDSVAVFAEIADNESRLHTVDIAARIRSDDGREVHASLDERDSRELAASGGAFTFLAMIPLEKLPAGRYVLTVDARARLGGHVAARDVEFWVR